MGSKKKRNKSSHPGSKRLDKQAWLLKEGTKLRNFRPAKKPLTAAADEGPGGQREGWFWDHQRNNSFQIRDEPYLPATTPYSTHDVARRRADASKAEEAAHNRLPLQSTPKHHIANQYRLPQKWPLVGGALLHAQGHSHHRITIKETGLKTIFQHFPCADSTIKPRVLFDADLFYDTSSSSDYQIKRLHFTYDDQLQLMHLRIQSHHTSMFHAYFNQHDPFQYRQTGYSRQPNSERGFAVHLEGLDANFMGTYHRATAVHDQRMAIVPGHCLIEPVNGRFYIAHDFVPRQPNHWNQCPQKVRQNTARQNSNCAAFCACQDTTPASRSYTVRGRVAWAVPKTSLSTDINAYACRVYPIPRTNAFGAMVAHTWPGENKLQVYQCDDKNNWNDVNLPVKPIHRDYFQNSPSALCFLGEQYILAGFDDGTIMALDVRANRRWFALVVANTAIINLEALDDRYFIVNGVPDYMALFDSHMLVNRSDDAVPAVIYQRHRNKYESNAPGFSMIRDPAVVATSQTDGSIRIFDIRSGDCLARLNNAYRCNANTSTQVNGLKTDFQLIPDPRSGVRVLAGCSNAILDYAAFHDENTVIGPHGCGTVGHESDLRRSLVSHIP